MYTCLVANLDGLIETRVGLVGAAVVPAQRGAASAPIAAQVLVVLDEKL